MSLLARVMGRTTPYAIPPQGAIQQELMNTKFTPDVYYLEMFRRHWVFIYDTRMSIHNGPGLEGTNEGVAWTKRDYVLHKKELGKDSYPIALRSSRVVDIPPWRDPSPGDPFKIKGELWLLTTDQLFELDKEKENGQAFLRKRISVLAPDRPKRTFQPSQNYPFSDEPVIKEIRAWCYEGNPDIWRPLITEGQLFRAAKIYRPNTQRPDIPFYYYFSQTELNDV